MLESLRVWDDTRWSTCTTSTCVSSRLSIFKSGKSHNDQLPAEVQQAIDMVHLNDDGDSKQELNKIVITQKLAHGR